MKYETKEMILQLENKKIFGEAYFPISKSKMPFVIFSHGFNGRYRDFSQICTYLAERGIGSYSFDFCGGSMTSKSSLKTTEMTIFSEIKDLKAVIENVLLWDKVDQENLFLFGASQGGLISALVAEENKDNIKALMLLFPAFCIPDDWNKRFPKGAEIPESLEFWGFILGKQFIQSLQGYDVFEHIGGYNRDVILFHGDKDDIVNITYGEKAAGIYAKSEMIVFPDEGHGFSEEGSKKLILLVTDFILKNLQST